MLLQEYHPLPPFDLRTTLADVSESRRVLGFVAEVRVEEGLKEFVKWFKGYQLSRSKKEEVTQRNLLLE